MARGMVGISMRRDMFVVTVVVRLCGGFDEFGGEVWFLEIVERLGCLYGGGRILRVCYITMVVLRVGCESHCDEIKDFGSRRVGIVLPDNEKSLFEEGSDCYTHWIKDTGERT